MISVILILSITSVTVTLVFATHRLCQGDGGGWYFSDAPLGAALPCNDITLTLDGNVILYVNGTLQFTIRNADPPTSVTGIILTPSLSTIVTTQTTTTCQGCSTETRTITENLTPPCVGLVPIAGYSYQTERCTFSSGAIHSGESFAYVVNFANGQSVSGSLIAQ